MAEQVEKTEAAEVKAKAGEAATGNELAELVIFLASTNRISSHLETAISELNANISLTDWLLLHTLKTEGPMPATKIAFKIGVTRQRVHQQMTALVAAGFLLKEDGDDNKSKLLNIAPGGAVLLKRIDRAIQIALIGDKGTSPEGPIRTASNTARRIARSLIPAQPKPDVKKSADSA